MVDLFMFRDINKEVKSKDDEKDDDEGEGEGDEIEETGLLAKQTPGDADAEEEGSDAEEGEEEGATEGQ